MDTIARSQTSFSTIYYILYSPLTASKEEEEQLVGNGSVPGKCRQDSWHPCAAAGNGSDSERAVEGSRGVWGALQVCAVGQHWTQPEKDREGTSEPLCKLSPVQLDFPSWLTMFSRVWEHPQYGCFSLLLSTSCSRMLMGSMRIEKTFLGQFIFASSSSYIEICARCLRTNGNACVES